MGYLYTRNIVDKEFVTRRTAIFLMFNEKLRMVINSLIALSVVVLVLEKRKKERDEKK